MKHAHWRRCDFQVHTPRDPNWNGVRPGGLGDDLPNGKTIDDPATVISLRREWAKAFLETCKKRNLNAIAITDHHELVMWESVRDEIQHAKSTDPDLDIWCFPGMELTARGGVQCLIIFDADLSNHWLQHALNKLGIAHEEGFEFKCVGNKVEQLEIEYHEIEAHLNATPQLRGRFIVLPNVSQGGQHTVLKDGWHSKFRSMPYVGGYLDVGQTVETLKDKNKTRLSGTDPKWSTREIYPLPTSDCRSSDFKTLGKNNCWIKLAEPTAEAIRQAFLAHQSRISIVEPRTPSLAVQSVTVSGSAILGEASCALSPELNAIIGGRGSGKSSFLEYTAFGLGRSCFDLNRPEYSGTDRMNALIKETLVDTGGSIEVSISQDNAVFKVKRSLSSAHQPSVTFPDGTTQLVTVKELRGLFPAVVYGQGELADLGKSTGQKPKLTDLLQFVAPTYKRDDDELKEEIKSAKRKTTIAVQRTAEAWALSARRRAIEASKTSAEQRVVALQKTLPKLSEEDQKKVDEFEAASSFEAAAGSAISHATQVKEDIQSLKASLQTKRQLPESALDEAKLLNADYEAFTKKMLEMVEAIESESSSALKLIQVKATNWSEKYAALKATRDEILEKLGEHKSVTAQIRALRDEIQGLATALVELDAEISEFGDVDTELNDALAALEASAKAHEKRTCEWALEIQKLSSGKIVASVSTNGNLEELHDGLERLSEKTGSQKATRIDQLIDQVKSTGGWKLLRSLVSDSLALLHWKQIGAGLGEEMPAASTLFSLIGTTDKVKKTMAELIDAERISEVATAIPLPQIELSYSDGDNEISFEKASEGQRAAALLFLLLELEGGPLLVDQPEGDLDNKIITELTEKLHEAKHRRQILFVSHNANLVVNGSSEMVACLDVASDGNRHFSHQGAIDDTEVRDAITSTMEGGEIAFLSRKDKYGF